MINIHVVIIIIITMRMRRMDVDARFADGSVFVAAMNVLRMIKMFGWERKIQEKVDERREVELGWVWKTKVEPPFQLTA